MSNGVTPENLQTVLLGLLTGVGGYSGMRLAKNIGSNLAPEKKDDNNFIDLTLPASRFKHAGAMDEYVLPTILGLGGAGAGFMGASTLYDKYKKNQNDVNLKKVQEDYIKALQLAHTKTASIKEATPNVDTLINGFIDKIADSLDKQADLGLPRQGFGEMFSDAAKGTASGAMDTDMGKLVSAGWLLTTLAGTGGTYWMAKQMAANKDKAKSQTVQPNEIRVKQI